MPSFHANFVGNVAFFFEFFLGLLLQSVDDSININSYPPIPGISEDLLAFWLVFVYHSQASFDVLELRKGMWLSYVYKRRAPSDKNVSVLDIRQLVLTWQSKIRFLQYCHPVKEEHVLQSRMKDEIIPDKTTGSTVGKPPIQV